MCIRDRIWTKAAVIHQFICCVPAHISSASTVKRWKWQGLQRIHLIQKAEPSIETRMEMCIRDSIDSVKFEDPAVQATYEDYIKTRQELGRTKPVNLMDIGTIAAKYLKSKGELSKLDESEEINACTVKIDVNVDGEIQQWLLLFKNETHNHPTEIEPFGGAATCVGGAIRDCLLYTSRCV